MRNKTLLIGLWAVLWAPGALAGDWSAKSRFNQNFEASDNRALYPDSAGATYLSTTQLRLDAIALLPTMSVEFNADVSYQNLSGPGADQNASPTDNSLGFKFENKLDNITTYHLGGYWQRQDATSAQLADTGIVIVGGDINTYVMEGGASRRLNPWDQLRWSTRGSIVDFSDAPGTSFYDILTTGAWLSQITKATHLITSLQFELVQQDDPANTQSLIGRVQTGFELNLSKHLTLKGSIGVGVQGKSQDTVLINTSGTSLSPIGPTGSDNAADGLLDFQVVYLPMASTTLTFSASHWTGPNVLGQVESRTVVGAALRQTINHLSSLWLRGEYTGQLPIADIFDVGDTNYLRASVTYDYRLAPDWIAQVSYRFAHRNDDEASANSNTIFLSAVRETTILP